MGNGVSCWDPRGNALEFMFRTKSLPVIMWDIITCRIEFLFNYAVWFRTKIQFLILFLESKSKFWDQIERKLFMEELRHVESVWVILCFLFQGPCCRTREEFSFDGLYFSWISTFSNSGIFRRVEYGKFRRNFSCSYCWVCIEAIF